MTNKVAATVKKVAIVVLVFGIIGTIGEVLPMVMDDIVFEEMYAQAIITAITGIVYSWIAYVLVGGFAEIIEKLSNLNTKTAKILKEMGENNKNG